MELTEQDVIKAWVYWFDLGLEPPSVGGLDGFKKAVREMWWEFRKAERNIFARACAAAAKDMLASGKWPQNYRIGMYIALIQNHEEYKEKNA